MKRILTGTLIIVLALIPGPGWIILAWWWLRRPSPAPERKAAPATGRQIAYLKRADWRALLDRRDVLILDVETTGLDDRAEVVEVAVLDTTGAERYAALSLPQGRIPRAASRVHGLTRKRLTAAGARPWPEVHAELADVLKDAAGMLAWNASFDARMLAQTADRHGLTLPRVAWRDALADYRALRPGGRHRLVDALKREGATVDGPAHRAGADCRAVLAVMRAVVEAGA